MNMTKNKNDAAELLFEYTGKGCAVPHDVTIVRFHPSVIEVEEEAFHDCNNLREVVFRGVPREIGFHAFFGCTLLERFTFPTISARLDNLIQTGHWDEIENEVDEVRGVVERSGDYSINESRR